MSSSSSSHLCLQVFFLFKSSSSSSLLHLWIWITTTRSTSLYHHSICIITWFGSSSSMYHHHIWIIIIGAISEWSYLLIILVTGSSTEPTLFHAGCRPTLHVGLQRLYLTLSQNGLPSSYIYLILSERHAQHSHLTSSCKKGPALTSNHV